MVVLRFSDMHEIANLNSTAVNPLQETASKLVNICAKHRLRPPPLHVLNGVEYVCMKPCGHLVTRNKWHCLQKRIEKKYRDGDLIWPHVTVASDSSSCVKYRPLFECFKMESIRPAQEKTAMRVKSCRHIFGSQ